MLHQDQSTKLWTSDFMALTGAMFLLFLNLQMLLAAFPAHVKQAFQAGDVTVSLITSVFAASAIAARFLTVALLRKYHHRTVLFCGLGIAAGTTWLYAFAGSIGSLLLLRVCYGIGFGMSSTVIPTLVARIVPGNRMGEGIGYFGLSTSLAMSVGPILGLNTMDLFGFVHLSAVGAVIALVVIPLLLASRAIPTERIARQPIRAEGAVRRANRGIVVPAVLNVLLAITYSGLLSFIALFGQMRDIKQVGLFFLMNAISLIVIRPVSGVVFDKYGHGAVLLPAALSVAASLVILSYTDSLLLLTLSALLYGFGFGSIQPTLQAWMLMIVPREQQGLANSLFYNSTDVGIAIGAVVLGALAAVSDYAIMYRWSAGFMAAFLVVYGSMQGLARIKRLKR